MSDKKVENKVDKDVAKVKKDVDTLVEDSSTQLSDGFEKMTDEAKESVVDAALTAKKDVGHTLIEYNAKVQKVAERVPGDFSQKVASYPWVAITAALVVGFVLGGLFKPSR
jgi:ElaB/YqjD/DUF883 family membrane-anchored ribosome-binding protein